MGYYKIYSSSSSQIGFICGRDFLTQVFFNWWPKNYDRPQERSSEVFITRSTTHFRIISILLVSGSLLFVYVYKSSQGSTVDHPRRPVHDRSDLVQRFHDRSRVPLPAQDSTTGPGFHDRYQRFHDRSDLVQESHFSWSFQHPWWWNVKQFHQFSAIPSK